MEQTAPTQLEYSSLLQGLLLDFERRLSRKIFDVNRTLTALSSELRRSITVENVPNIVLERAFAGRLCGKPKTDVSTVEELLTFVPPHMLVRKHYAGDFCLALPIFKCVSALPSSSFTLHNATPLSPNFFAAEGELFVPLRTSSFSDKCVDVISPFPGESPVTIDPHCYPPFRVSCGESDFVFPPNIKNPGAHEDEDGDDEQDDQSVLLRGVRKGDVGAAADPGVLSIGDVLMVRGHMYKVKAVTDGGMPYEVFGGADLIAFHEPFPFNAQRVVGRRCLPVIVRAKYGYMPRSALAPHEPVTLHCASTGIDKKFGMGAFNMEFSTLSFNEHLVCHRDSILPEHLK